MIDNESLRTDVMRMNLDSSYNKQVTLEESLMAEVELLKQKLSDSNKHCEQLEKDMSILRRAYADAVNKISELKAEKEAK